MNSLKLQSFKKFLPIQLMFWILSLLYIIFLWIPTLQHFSSAPIPLEEVDFSGDIENLYVTGTLTANMGYFYELIDLQTKKVDARDYIIPVDDYYFMGLYANGTLTMADANNLLDATVSYYDNTIDETQLAESQYVVTGIIEKMDSSRLAVYEEYLSELDAETRARFLPYHIRVTTADSEFRFVNSFGCGAIVLSILLPVLTISGLFQKNVRKYIKNSPNPTLAREKLLSFLTTTSETDGLRYNKEFICGVCDGFTIIVDTAKVVRMYSQPNSLPFTQLTMSAYFLIFVLEDGTKKMVELKNAAIAGVHMYHINQLCPWISIGMIPKKFHNISTD